MDDYSLSRGNQDDSHQITFDDVVARYLERYSNGQQADRDELLRSFPQYAAELREFFADHDLMCRAMVSDEDDEELVQHAVRVSRMMDEPTLDVAERRSSDATVLDLPRRFGDYELLEEIERGGMGVVFRARQVSLDRQVALKMIKSGQLAGNEEVMRFRIEAEAAASLNHPGIVAVYDVGEIEGQHYFSMQFVQGRSLADRLSNGPLSPVDAATLVMKVARAVAYAHDHGVIHRDLKPGNVLLDESGEPKITDFGLAKRVRHDSHLTATGQILGTPAYMSPEQASGHDGRIDQKTDVYALGAILYVALTAQPPFTAASEIDILLKVLGAEPIPPSKVNRRVPRALERICAACMEKKPVHRYSSAAAVARDLEHFLRDEPLEIRSQGFVSRVRRWARREPALAAHVIAICAFVLLLVWAFYNVGGETDYFLRHFAAFLSWAGMSVVMQKLMNRPAWANVARFAWASADAIWMTLILIMAQPPRGPLLVGYPVLIVASGMLARVRLVAFTTVVSIAGYVVMLCFRPEEAAKPHFCLFHGLGLLVIGCVVAAQVRRIRSLSRYYDVDPSIGI